MEVLEEVCTHIAIAYEQMLYVLEDHKSDHYTLAIHHLNQIARMHTRLHYFFQRNQIRLPFDDQVVSFCVSPTIINRLRQEAALSVDTSHMESTIRKQTPILRRVLEAFKQTL